VTRSTLFEHAQKLAKWTILAGCMAAFFRSVPTLFLPFQINYVEGPLLNGALNVARGLGAYPPSSGLPYVINQYGPPPYYLIALVVKLFGVGLTGPRLLAFACAICSAVLIALLVRHWTGSFAAALIFGVLYLTLPTVQQWMVILRVDFIAVALSLAGLYLFAKSDRWQLSVLFFVAALFSKFMFVAAPLACLMYLLLMRETQKAFRFAAACAGLAGVVFLAFQWASGGWFAFHTLWSTMSHSFDFRVAVTSLQWELLDNLALLLLAAVAMAFSYNKLPRRTLLLPLLYFCVVSLTLISRGKEGADSNYYLEWDAALCLMAGLGYGVVDKQLRDSRAAAALLPALVVLAVFANVSLADAYRFVHPGQYADQPLGCRDAYQYVRSHSGDQVLSENVGAAVLAGKSPVVFDPFVWTREVAEAGWSDDELLALIRARKLDLIVLGSEAARSKNDRYAFRWPRSVLAAIDQNYKLVDSYDCTDASFLYVPRQDAPLAAANRR
jgi:hypothetical protein